MRLHAVVVLLLIVIVPLCADTIPGGDVSGTWYAGSSPYYITGNIAIPASDTLIIEPDVRVDFLGNYTFQVYGLLNAVGTESDSIILTADTTRTEWAGLFFVNAPDSSHLEYCLLENTFCSFNSLVYCYNSNPVITHCLLRNGRAASESGGLTICNCSPVISYCTISGNHGTYGGGIRCNSGGAPTISNCTITGNTVPTGTNGGGIQVDNGSHPMLEGCTIVNNRALQGGGIAVVDGGSCTITDCIIEADSAYGSGGVRRGGGIYMNSDIGTLAITNTYIHDCFCLDSAGGIYIENADCVSIERSILDHNYAHSQVGALYAADCGNLLLDHCDVVSNDGYIGDPGIKLNGATNLTLTNCIFRSQNGEHISFNAYSSALVAYSDFYDWVGAPFSGTLPAGLGELVQTNYNGDSCDVYYNIYLDPLFEDFPNGNYHLLWGSPCIDAGDPAFAYDPDGTITDMGRYYFNQVGTAEQPLSKSVQGAYIGTTIWAGPLVLPQGKNYTVFDITGREINTIDCAPGIYFIEENGTILTKIIKVR
jgi:parallel beta-helix repeat protein